MRPTAGADERQRWDALMATHHYLPFRGLVGRSLRHVAVLGEHWLALVGWHAGAFKLKARDRWIGWLPEQQFRRLHLIANNARFVILPGCSVPNLASRVLALSLRRLSEDMCAAHGHLVLLAETFVDRSRFTGACYRASNWQVLGHTQGFARKPGTPATWVPHGRPKEVLVYPLVRDSREQLRALDDGPRWRSQGDPEPWTANRLRSLWECLRTVPEFRGTRGRRYPLATILAIAVAAKLAGYHGTRAFAEFASGLTQHQLRALRAFYSHRLGRFTAPTTTAFFNVLVALDPEVLDRAARTWAAQQNRDHEPVIDGKRIRGAAPQPRWQAPPRRCGRASLREGARAGSGRAQEQRIPAVRTLTLGLDLKGRVVPWTRCMCSTIPLVVESCGAHYVISKPTSPTCGPRARLPEARTTEHRTANNGTHREAKLADLTNHPDKAAHRGGVSHRARAAKRGRSSTRPCTASRFEQATAELVLSLVWALEHLDSITCATRRPEPGAHRRAIACLNNLGARTIRVSPKPTGTMREDLTTRDNSSMNADTRLARYLQRVPLDRATHRFYATPRRLHRGAPEHHRTARVRPTPLAPSPRRHQ